MVSTFLACLLLWMLYLWLDRRRLLRLINPSKPVSRPTFTPKPAPTYKASSKPRFINSKPLSSHPPAPSAPQQTSLPTSEPPINFNALQQVAELHRKEHRRVSPQTQHELYRLVRGDAETVKRLVLHSRSRYPDKNEQWVWEKVICDLERDRGYR